MIFTDRKITIRNGKSSINEPVILYRGDFEVSIRFTIMESKFRFKSGVNLVDSEKASHGQLAILTPYGGNVFSETVKCEDGTVTFTLTKEMIDQLEEVGLYSFQIRLFDYYKESRVSIPPVEFGIEVREPVASEDHDNTVNNAIVGYSIAKVVDPSKENVGDTFDVNGNYNKTDWETGDRISEGKLNKIEDAIDVINKNTINEHANLDKKINSNFAVLDATKANAADVNSKVWTMKNMGQDVKEAMTGGSVPVVGERAVLNENINDFQIQNAKLADEIIDGRLIKPDAFKYDRGFVKVKIKLNPDNANVYILATIPNTFGGFNVGDTVRFSYVATAMIDGKMPDISPYLTRVLIASSEYTDDTQYDVTNLIDMTAKSINDSHTFNNRTAVRIDDLKITKAISADKPYIILGVQISGLNSDDIFDLELTDIKLQVNNGGWVHIDDIVYGGIFRSSTYGIPMDVSYGKPMNLPTIDKPSAFGEDSIDAKVISMEGLIHNFKKYYTVHYVPGAASENVNNWFMMSYKNPFGTIAANTQLTYKFKFLQLNESGKNRQILVGKGTTAYPDNTDFMPKTAVPNYSSYDTGIYTVYDEVIEVSRTVAWTTDISEEYLCLLVAANAGLGIENKYIVADIQVGIDDEFIDIEPVHYDMYTCKNPEKYSYASVKLHEGSKYKLLSSITNDDIPDKSITMNKIHSSAFKYGCIIHNEINMTPKSDDLTIGQWVIATISYEDLVITNNVIEFEAMFELTDGAMVYPDYGVCIGSTNYDDATDYSVSLINYHREATVRPTYENNVLRIEIPKSWLTDAFADYKYMQIGWKVKTPGMIDGTDNHKYSFTISDTSNSPNPIVFASVYLARTSVKSDMALNGECILTSSNYANFVKVSGNDIGSVNNSLKGKKISIMGDSISTYQGWIPSGNKVYYTGSNCGITSVNQTWWKRVIDDLGLELCVNQSWSGSTMTIGQGANQAGCMARAESLHTDSAEPDIIILFMGTNDFHREQELGSYNGTQAFPTDGTTFREAYAICLNKVLTRYPYAKVYLGTLMQAERNTPTQFPESNANGVMLTTWNAAIRELADLFGLDVIEFNKCGITYQNANLTMGDMANGQFLHPNALGMQYMAEKVKKTLLSK